MRVAIRLVKRLVAMKISHASVLVVVIGVTGNCNEEEFELAADTYDAQKAVSADAMPSGNEILERGGGSYDGDPIIYVQQPSKVDPANKYKLYKVAPVGSWVANELVTSRSNPMTIASMGNAPTRTESITIRTNRQTSTQQISSNTPVSTASINQITRRVYKDEFTQTGVEATQTQLKTNVRSFAGKQAGLLDILLVIDTSGSMLQEVRAMAAALPKLLTKYTSNRYNYNSSYYYLHRTDWRIGLVASSPEDECEIVGVFNAEGVSNSFK